MAYPDNILEVLRQRWDLKWNDTSEDDKLNALPKEKAFREICHWYLGPGWGSQILFWLKDCDFETEEKNNE